MILRQDKKTGCWDKNMQNVHNPELCRGRGCAIHDHPSVHPLMDAPLNWREDRGILERICEHGIGHPDYDSAKYLESIGQGYENIHGCDFCCHSTPTETGYDMVVEAISELDTQMYLIAEQSQFVNDNTLYRAWVKAVIPSLIKLLLEAEDALATCTHPEDIAMWDNHVALAKTILGKV